MNDFRARIREENERERAAVRGFVDTAVSGDVKGFIRSIDEVAKMFVWTEAMRAITRQPAVSEEIRTCFLWPWLTYGNALRNVVSDDKVLLNGLRALLPSYNGPPKRLYRGDSFYNRKRRTYGCSWSADKEVAEAFARGIYQTFNGGSVLLETVAPPAAIICAPSLIDDSYAEDEYVVDRRRLAHVRVIARFSQRPI